MPLLRPFDRLRRRTVRLPRLASYTAAAGFVALGLGTRHVAGLLDWPTPTAMLFFVFAIAAAATMNHGAGYFATLLAALGSALSVPTDEDGFVRSEWIPPLVVFVLLGMTISALIESLAHALKDREDALKVSQDATRRRALLLVEHRHRTNGDLQAISSLLRLRGRHLTDPVGKAALAEAAGHTVALGRIHTRLERAEHDVNEVAMVDAGAFVIGVGADMVPPVSDSWGVPRWISTDRAVALGLLVCELVAEARRDGSTWVALRLSICGTDFVLRVVDDRAEVGETDGMRTRLIGLLAGQLRGGVTRVENEPAPGWTATLRFPVEAPNLAPGRVGRPE